MGFMVEYLDLILVPAGLLILFTYHLFLIYRVLKHPSTTVIGYENHNRMAWVESMMQGDSSHIGLALSVMSNNETGAIYLATICLTLSSLIGAWVGSTSTNLFKNVLILGDTTPAIISIKYICMIVAFMLAFGSFLQSARYYFQADFFITMPNSDVPVRYVQSSVLKGNNFWHFGLRLLYFALVLLFWSFGPIPMFASCLITVVILSFMDYNSAPLHQFRKVTKSPVKKVVEDVAAPVRDADRRGKPVAELTSTLTSKEHYGGWKS